jgi:hypothetical protein
MQIKCWHSINVVFPFNFFCFKSTFGWVWFMVFNATFKNISVISWQSVLLVNETGVHGENPRPTASHWQTLWHYHALSNRPRLSGIRTHNVSDFEILVCHNVKWILFELYFFSRDLHTRGCLISNPTLKNTYSRYSHLQITIEWVNDCCLTPTKKFFSHIMVRTN